MPAKASIKSATCGLALERWRLFVLGRKITLAPTTYSYR
jgi:hypothetical protein